LEQALDLTLRVGQLLLAHGADARRVEETIHRFAYALGCAWIDVLIYANGLVLSVGCGDHMLTRTRQVYRRSVNLAVVTAVNDLSRQAAEGRIARTQIGVKLNRILGENIPYGPWMVTLCMALACGAFSRLFGGDWPAFAITLTAALAGMTMRLWLEQRQTNQLLLTVVSAFVAGLIAASGSELGWSQTPQVAPAAAVLFLVPGVPLLNSVEDLIYGFVDTGISRGVHAAMISLGIALGLWMALFVLQGVGF
jgi:uncharacterized membrane protein YjjP (DUF1212 family)